MSALSFRLNLLRCCCKFLSPASCCKENIGQRIWISELHFFEFPPTGVCILYSFGLTLIGFLCSGKLRDCGNQLVRECDGMYFSFTHALRIYFVTVLIIY